MLVTLYGVALWPRKFGKLGSIWPKLKVVECLAIREGITFALERGFHNWVLESDANNVVRAIQLPSSRAL
ncbi:hypothetical protein L484_024587 [Morus notabilis]|uniref:RNase H type-1 domain-containing protein n=1 Tax=Morus notabilis TaxID=981085 RepID=W9S6X3_9ROSA|nr:hypothetical protein L484_024587 [Morus notabilis]